MWKSGYKRIWHERKLTMDETAPLNQQSQRTDDVTIHNNHANSPTQQKQPLTNRDIDRGWAWVVLITTYITRILMGGMLWAINIYFVIYHEEFGESRSYTAAIGSATFFTFNIAAPLSSVMIQKYGVRITTIVGSVLVTINYVLNVFSTGVLYLLFTHCLFMGIGLSFVSNANLVGLSQYFRRYVNFATGLSLSGTGVGMFIFARLIPYLIDSYGWRGSKFALAGLSLQFCVCGSVLFPLASPLPSTEKPKQKPKSMISGQVIQLLSSPSLWWLNLNYFSFAVSSVTIMVLYKDIAILYGMENVFPLCIMIFGAGDIVGRAISGLVTSHPKIQVPIFYASVHICTALVIILHTVAVSGVTSFMILGFFLGSVSGAQIALISIAVLAMFGRETFVPILGYVQFFAGIGALSGPPLTGYLTDSTGSYDVGLAFIAIMDVIAATSCFLAYYFRKRQMRASEAKADLTIETQANLLNETKLKSANTSVA